MPTCRSIQSRDANKAIRLLAARAAAPLLSAPHTHSSLLAHYFFRGCNALPCKASLSVFCEGIKEGRKGMGRGERDRAELRDGYPPFRSPGLSLSLPTLSPLPMPCSASAACNRVTGSSTEQPSSLSLFLFPEVSRVSEEDGSAIKQLAVKVTDRRSRRVPLPIGGLTLFWNSMGRTFFWRYARRSSIPRAGVRLRRVRQIQLVQAMCAGVREERSANHYWNSWRHGKLNTWTSSFPNEFMHQLEPGNDSISRTMQTGSHSWGVGTAQATRGGGEGR